MANYLYYDQEGRNIGFGSSPTHPRARVFEIPDRKPGYQSKTLELGPLDEKVIVTYYPPYIHEMKEVIPPEPKEVQT